MGKRLFSPLVDEENSAKRQRRESNGLADSKTTQDAPLTVDDLKRLLTFQQDAGPQLRQNISRVKAYLESIAYGDENEKDRSSKLAVLLAYLRSVTPSDDDKDADSLPGLLQTWRFAVQTNNNGLQTAVPALLALLLKTVSALIDFRDIGVKLCQTLLRADQVKLLDNGLSASKNLERLISPCLRLLTEVVSFDGGSSARSLYRQRDVTFKRLDNFLGMRTSHSTTRKDGATPTIRKNALRYFLANLRYQDRSVKSDILTQSGLLRAVFQGIKDDPAEVILEILQALMSTVVSDDMLPRKVKSRLLTDSTLCHIATLYDYPDKTEVQGNQRTVSAVAHSFLIQVCTTVDQGVLVAQHGWYPPGTEALKADPDSSDISLAASQYMSHTKYTERVPVRNTTLASFIQKLRPYANERHNELILSIFNAAPELVADYFLRKKTFSFEPKLSATWTGYTAFLVSVVKLAAVQHAKVIDGVARKPPPPSIVLENILPQPLTQKALTRCLTQNSALVTFLAVRLLIFSFRKLGDVLSSFRSGEKQLRWEGAASSLMKAFCEKCPELKHVITAFRACSIEQSILREALGRLISLYYKVTPQLALQEKFDISIPLADALISANTGAGPSMDDASGMQQLELDNLVTVASFSPDMSWWKKPEKMLLSPFTSILRLQTSGRTLGTAGMRELLEAVAYEHYILQDQTTKALPKSASMPSTSSMDALLASLKDYNNSDAVFEFLDNCIVRLVRKPIKYSGDAAAMRQDAPETVNGKSSESSPQQPSREPGFKQHSAVSLLIMVIVEQWHYFVRDGSAADIVTVASWIACYLRASRQIGEDNAALIQARDDLKAATKAKDVRSAFKGAFKARVVDIPTRERVSPGASTRSIEQTRHADDEHITDSKQTWSERIKVNKGTVTSGDGMPLPIFEALRPPSEAHDYPQLNRWSKKDIADAVEDGDVSELMLCLCSADQPIRRQALSQLKVLYSKLEKSGYREWQRLYLLIGEVIETTNQQAAPDEALPSLAVVFAAKAVVVLNDPLHDMYVKINQFLNRGPAWKIAHLPSYWINKIFLHPAANDDAHYREVEWLLDVFIHGLRTPTDMELYRRCAVFERVLSLAQTPTISKAVMAKILQLLYRCTFVAGASTTLITRCGVMSWLRAQVARAGHDDKLLRATALQLYATCDEVRVREWSHGDLGSFVDEMRE